MAAAGTGFSSPSLGSEQPDPTKQVVLVAAGPEMPLAH